MSKSQRAKGQRYERECCRLLEPIMPGLRRQQQTRRGAKPADIDRDQGDPHGPAPVRLECSHGQRPSPHSKYAQAERDAEAVEDERPIVVLTKRDRGPTLVTMWIGEWMELWRMAYGGLGSVKSGGDE